MNAPAERAGPEVDAAETPAESNLQPSHRSRGKSLRVPWVRERPVHRTAFRPLRSGNRLRVSNCTMAMRAIGTPLAFAGIHTAFLDGVGCKDRGAAWSCACRGWWAVLQHSGALRRTGREETLADGRGRAIVGSASATRGRHRQGGRKVKDFRREDRRQQAVPIPTGTRYSSRG